MGAARRHKSSCVRYTAVFGSHLLLQGYIGNLLYVPISHTCVLKLCRYGVDYDGAEFEFTPMVAHDLKGTLAGAQAVLLRVMPLQHVVSAHSHVPSLSTSE